MASIKANYDDLEKAECGNPTAKRRLLAAFRQSGMASYDAWVEREFPTLNSLPGDCTVCKCGTFTAEQKKAGLCAKHLK